MRIILASKSPRRKEILENLGLEFEITVTEADESRDIKDSCELVMAIASRKGRAVVEMLGESIKRETLVIACDTLVHIDGEHLGKPKNADDARRMLRLLSGETHEVVSGLYLWYEGKEIRRVASTKVIFDRLLSRDIEKYIASGEPYDKAGAYAVQGRASAFVKAIEGDYFNVVGLPVNLLVKTLREEFKIEL